MHLSRVSQLPLAALLATVIMVGMPALARLQPKPAEDPWLRMRPELHPVAGTLVYEGRPIEGAVVTFVAQNDDVDREYLAVSSTDKQGRFWLRTFSSHGDGAVAGTHLVRVEQLVPTGRMLAGPGMESMLELGSIPPWLNLPAEPGMDPGPVDPTMMDPMMGWSVFPGMPEMINILPARFADEKTSGLVAEVTAAGPNEFLIRLQAEPPPAPEEPVDEERPLVEQAAG